MTRSGTWRPDPRGPAIAWPARRCVHMLLALVAMLLLGPARAHEFTLDAAMNAFVKVEPTQAQVVVRAPLYLFRAVRMPSRNGEVDVDASAAALERAAAAMQQGLLVYEDGRPLKATSARATLSLPSDRSFESYETAAAHVAAPIEPGTRIVVDQGWVDVHLVYPIVSPKSVLALRTTVAPELGDYLKLTVRYLPLEGDSKVMVLRAGSGVVDLNPSFARAAGGFVSLGVVHIATGIDHLLFLLCLVVPVRGLRPLLAVVTAFTLGHSFTLLGSAFGLGPQGAWFGPFVEMLIAVSIVYTALENIVGVSLPRRVLLALLFGLVHGFAFSQSLAEELQFAGAHLLVALFAFNLGIELGQVLALLLMLPLLGLLTRHVLKGRTGAVILSAVLAQVGWAWMQSRWDALSKVRWPVIDAAALLQIAAWVAALVLVGMAVRAAVVRLGLDVSPARRGVMHD